jgi:pilus assembly protein CpaB
MGRRALVLAIALVLGLVAGFAIWRYLNGIESEFREAQEQVEVFRAVVAIQEGTLGAQVLQGAAASFEKSQEQREDLPTDYIATQEQLEALLANRVAVGPISANEILVESQWGTLSVELTPLVDLIDEGLEAVTVSPDVIAGVNGFVRPGDKVNILVTLEIAFDLTDVAAVPEFGIPTEPAAEGETQDTQEEIVQYTRYVLNQVPVIAVGRKVTAEEGAPETVTVETTPAADQGTVQGEAAPEEAVSSVYTLALPPEDIERLVFAQANGALYFTLIPEDYVLTETKGVTINTLFAGDLVEDIFGN